MHLDKAQGREEDCCQSPLRTAQVSWQHSSQLWPGWWRICSTEVLIRLLYLCLQVSVDPLALCCLSVSMFQLNLHLIQVGFHLLSQANSFAAAADFCFQVGLHHLQRALVVPPV